MYKKLLAPVLISSLVLAAACSSKKKEEKKKAMEVTEAEALPTAVTQQGLDKVTESWPDTSKSAIKSLDEKYGLPSAVTEDMVVWSNTAPFKRSIVYKEEVIHEFPMQHSDVLVQTIDYRVPQAKVGDIAKFDGSMLVDRTKGELSARGSSEPMNILALNLADKIVRGEMTVEQARREYSKNAEAYAAGTTNQMLTSLNIKSQGNTSDPDSMMQAQEPSQTKAKKAKKKTTKEVQKTMQ